MMMLAIVSDFPVPGGPSRTKSWLFVEASTATNCELSQFSGVKISLGLPFDPIHWGIRTALFACRPPRLVNKMRHENIFFEVLESVFQVFHIKYLVKEKEATTQLYDLKPLAPFFL